MRNGPEVVLWASPWGGAALLERKVNSRTSWEVGGRVGHLDVGIVAPSLEAAFLGRGVCLHLRGRTGVSSPVRLGLCGWDLKSSPWINSAHSVLRDFLLILLPNLFSRERF